MHAAAHPPLLLAHSSTSAHVMPFPVKPDLHRHVATLVVAHVAFGSHVRSPHVIGGGVSIGASAGGGAPSISAGSGGYPQAATHSTSRAEHPRMGFMGLMISTSH